ncbi:MAG: DUF2877 domain-containing protein [Caldisericia bacterium]|uniref:DUF2877 domain-containing protein n=1 Tax=Thermodesulfovibrio yellowstonii TaxID=28262 RepID=UPI003C7BDA99
MKNDFEEKNLLISFGDKISLGEYIIHSKFKNSINFSNKEKLITLGNRNIGSGPSNIIFDKKDFESINKITIFENLFYINDEEFKIEKEKIYSSNLKISNFDIQIFNNNLQIFEKYLKIFSKNKGLIPLIDSDLEKTENLINNFIKRIHEGMKILFDEDIVKGIKLIKGVGIGLTPSGDDFIYGVLAGLTVLEIIKKENNFYLKKLIYENAKGDNLISNNFLYYASEGLFFEKTKKLILSIFFGSEREIVDSTVSILQIGETSGVDFSTGLLITIKKGGLNGSKRFN